MITFTGIDERTVLYKALQYIQNRNMEWGVLFSEAKEGKHPRYPSFDYIPKITEALPREVLSAHLCGRASRDILSGYLNPKVMDLIYGKFRRMQINFSYKSLDDINAVLANTMFFDYLRLDQVIFQIHGDNLKILSHFEKYLDRGTYVVLLDASGGRGVESEWPTAIENIVCGYAGGIGPDNIEKKIEQFLKVRKHYDAWIDMESKVRTDDWLDMSKVGEVLLHPSSYQLLY